MNRSVSFEVAPNIAIVKYWGKRDPVLNLPLNSSLSVTLSSNNLNTRTTVSTSSSFERDEIIFDGKNRDLSSDQRIANMVSIFRNLVKEKKGAEGEQLAQTCIHIETRNCFPTKAGLASSASGFACLALCLSRLYGVLTEPEDANVLSCLTRQASGSACRSLYGGLVYWKRGICEDGHDSVSSQLLSADHWPELRVCICVTTLESKKVGSTEGMNRCVATSERMQKRTAEMVEMRIEMAIQAYQKRDFQSLGPLIMKESDDLHAICEDAKPPLHYRTDTSRLIQSSILALNQVYQRVVAAYSFDAGPNAFIFFEAQDETIVETMLNTLLRPREIQRAVMKTELGGREMNEVFLQTLSPVCQPIEAMIITTVGNGPQQISLVSSNKPFIKRTIHGNEKQIHV